jgi:superfamily II DNA or RNA helicase
MRVVDGMQRGEELTVLTSVEDIIPLGTTEPSLDRIGRAARFGLLHQAFLIGLSPPSDVLIAPRASAVRYEPYQHVPAYRALQMPRPRLLVADDTGLGKTIEAGIILRELNARRRANRVLIVCPAGIMTQWQDELFRKFGMRFEVFDREGVHDTRLQFESGLSPWSVKPRVIASMDFIKRREGAFQDLSSSRWDVVVVDEAHHLSGSRDEQDEVTDRHRLGRWLSEAADALLFLTATPHDGYDERFASLLELLDPALVPGGQLSYPRYERHLVRRLKRHIRDDRGDPKFVERAPVQPVPVRLTSQERAMHERVREQARQLDTIADTVARRRRADAEAIRLVATVLRKRAASSRAALQATIQARTSNLQLEHDRVELRREHLRALHRGETIPEDAQRELERDAHRNYLSVVRGYGADLRRLEDERAALEELQGLLDDCLGTEESKMQALLAWLGGLPDGERAIIFSEYTDTVQAIHVRLEADDRWRGRSVVLTGDLGRAERDAVLCRFA